MKKIIEKNINIPLTPIEDFLEKELKELKEIGKEWAKELIKKAHIRARNG